MKHDGTLVQQHEARKSRNSDEEDPNEANKEDLGEVILVRESGEGTTLPTYRENGVPLGNVEEEIDTTGFNLEATQSTPVHPSSAHEEREYMVDSIFDHDKRYGVR